MSEEAVVNYKQKQVLEAQPNEVKQYARSAMKVQDLLDASDPNETLYEAGSRLVNELIATNPYRRKLEAFSQKTIGVRPVRIEAKGALVVYQAQLGKLTIEIKMLNTSVKAPRDKQSVVFFSQAEANEIRLKRSLAGEIYVAKRHYFCRKTRVLRTKVEGMDWEMDYTYAEVSNLLEEYSFAKICSIMGVGAKVGSPDHCFDIVCYQNCVEFYMERCTPILKMPLDLPSKRHIEERLRYCMHLMHKYGLIHKDIKPDNILVNSKGQIVFADFGISMFVKQQQGEKSWTYKEGTAGYMSPEMCKLHHTRSGKIDLYYNDLWALEISIEKIVKSQEALRTTSNKRPMDEITKASTDEMEIAQMYSAYLKGDSGDITFRSCFSQNQDIEITYLNFLVRSVGVSYRLLPYLQKIGNPEKKIRLLIERLQKGIDDELAFSVSNSQQLGDEEMLRRTCFRVLKKLESMKEPDPQLSVVVCELACEFIRSLHLMGLSEQPFQLLNRIQRFSLFVNPKEFHALRVANYLIESTFDPLQVQKYITSGLDKKDYLDLLPGVIGCLRKKEIALGILILRGCFPDVAYVCTENSEKEAFILLYWIFKSVVAREQPVRIIKTILRILEIEYRLGNHNWILILLPHQIERLPLELKKVYYQKSALARVLEHDPQAVSKFYAAAYKLSCELESEWSIGSLTIDIDRHVFEQMHGISKNAAAVARKTLEYVTCIGSAKERMLAASAHWVLAEEGLKRGSASSALLHLKEALEHLKTAVKYRFAGSHLFAYCVFSLTRIFSQKKFKPVILSLVRAASDLADEYCSEPFHRKVFIDYPAQTITKLMLEILGESKQSSCESYNVSAIQNGYQRALSHSHCMRFLMNFDRSRAHKEALAIDLELQSCKHTLRIKEFTQLTEAFICMKELGMAEQSAKWCKFIIKNAQKFPYYLSTGRTDAILDFLWSMGFQAETYALIAPFTGNSSVCAFYAGVWLMMQKQYSSSEKLFLECISRNSLDDPNELIRSALYCSNIHLTNIYKVTGQQQKYKTELNRVLISYRNFEQRGIIVQTRSFLNFLYENNLPQEHHYTIKQLYEKAAKTSTEYDRFAILKEMGRAMYDIRRYECAIQWLKAAKINAGMVFEVLLALAQSYIIVCKVRAFYRVAKQLIAENPLRQSELKDFLTKRKEFVKVNVLFGECPSGYTSLAQVTQWLKSGIPTEQGNKKALGSKLRDLKILKRVMHQTKFVREIKTTTNESPAGNIRKRLLTLTGNQG